LPIYFGTSRERRRFTSVPLSALLLVGVNFADLLQDSVGEAPFHICALICSSIGRR
jgi:hypothetical protein